MSLANTLSPPNVTPEFVTDTGERQRRWLRRGCWGGSLFVVVALLAVVGYPSLIRWRLESRGWSIEFVGDRIGNRIPRFLEPWFGDGIAAMSLDSQMTADDVRLLSQFGQPVFHLFVARTTISDSTFEAIGQLEDLTNLYVGGRGHTEQGGRDITHLIPRFTTSQIDPVGWRHLSRLPRLRSLRIQGIELNEVGLKGIADCGPLRKLQLLDVKLSEDDLACLSKLRVLESLELPGRPISSRRLLEFKQTNPNLQISF